MAAIKLLIHLLVVLFISASAERWSSDCPCITYTNRINYDCLMEEVNVNGLMKDNCLWIYWKIGPLRSDSMGVKPIELKEFDCSKKYAGFTVVHVGSQHRLNERNMTSDDCKNMRFYMIASKEREFYDFVSFNFANVTTEAPMTCNLSYNIMDKTKTLSDYYTYPKYYRERINVTNVTHVQGKPLKMSQYWLKKHEGLILHTRSVMAELFETNQSLWSLGIVGVGILPEKHAIHVSYSCRWPVISSSETAKKRDTRWILQLQPFINESNFPSLMVESVRIFEKSSIKFSLFIRNPSLSDSANILCVFYPNTSENASKESDICENSLCEERGIGILLGPFLKLDGVNSQNEVEFCIRTGFQNIQYPDGTLEHIPTAVKPFYNLLKYDYFNGDYAKYSERWETPRASLISLKDFTSNSYADTLSQLPLIEQFKQTILLPGPFLNPKQLEPTELLDLQASCALCEYSAKQQCSSLSIDFRKGPVLPVKFFYQSSGYRWLNVAQQMSPSLNTWNVATRTDPFDLIASTPVGIITIRVAMPDDGDRIHMGCYHWMLQKWYIFLRETTSTPNQFQLVSLDSEAKDQYWNHLPEFKKVLKPQTIPPASIKCAQLHTMLAWGEAERVRLANGTKIVVQLRHLILDFTGDPVGKPRKILSKNMCRCSDSPLSAPLVEFLYPNLTSSEDLILAAICGNRACGNLWSNNQFTPSRTLLSAFPNHSHVVGFALDQKHAFTVLLNSLFSIHIDQHGASSRLGSECAFDTVAQECTSKEPSTITGSPHKRVGTIETFNTEDFLPRPKEECIFPNITRVILRMVDETTASMLVHVNYGSFCTYYAKPALSFRIQYSPVPNIIRHGKTAEQFYCKGDTRIQVTAAIHNLTCQSMNSKNERNLTRTYTIGNLRHNQMYYFKITSNVDLGDKYLKLWFAGITPPSHHQVFKTEYIPPSEILKIVLPAVLVPLCILTAACLAIFFWYYKKKLYFYRYLIRLSANEIDRKEQIGGGNFGEVWKAKIKNETVVVKILKESATYKEEKEFRDEALMLSKFLCDHIVNTVGICLQSRPVMLVLEYLNGGSLESYLRCDDVRALIGQKELLSISKDALKACLYLESEGYIHRDIAARNCLVQLMSEQLPKPKCVKLADFGLAKDIGHKSIYMSGHPDDEILPVAWSAPEVLQRGQSSTNSDVWSFGVLIWEVFSFAATPFNHCSLKNHDCCLPKLTPETVYAIICLKEKTLADFKDPCSAAFCPALKSIFQKCWNKNPSERPTFKQLELFLSGVSSEILNVKLPWLHKVVDAASGSNLHGVQDQCEHSGEISTEASETNMVPQSLHNSRALQREPSSLLTLAYMDQQNRSKAEQESSPTMKQTNGTEKEGTCENCASSQKFCTRHGIREEIDMKMRDKQGDSSSKHDTFYVHRIMVE